MHWTDKYKKAVTFSYDDGVEQDLRLLELFHKYGLKATFNLNTGLDAHNGSWEAGALTIRRLHLPSHVSAYDGHEIAVHGRLHKCLTALSPAELAEELEEDYAEIMRLFGQKPVGMAYPYGAYGDDICDKLREMGIRYARTVEPSGSFAVQSDLLRFRPTCHHDDPALFDLAEQFLESKSETPQIFYIWGHSYEFDIQDNWDRMERLCEMLAGKPDVFYGTNGEVLL